MKTFDLFNTLATARTSLKAGEVPVEDHIPIMENIAKVHPEDLIVSDYYNPDKAQQVIRQVCGLNNKWIVTGNGKETGKVWNGITSEGHLGDNPQTDIASAQAHGIPATLSTLHLQTPQEIKCGEIGWAMRAARLTTWNAGPRNFAVCNSTRSNGTIHSSLRLLMNLTAS